MENSQGLGEFTLLGEKEKGYSSEEVDAYFQQLAADYSLLRRGNNDGIISSKDIRTKSFSQEKGGYKPVEVDRALDRVEDKFGELERSLKKTELGEAQWNEELEVLANSIMGRLNRPEGERFRRPSKRLVKGYYMRDVDALCDKLKDHLQHDSKVNPKIIRRARFRSATGDMCYEETQVDAFLDRCIELILEIK